MERGNSTRQHEPATAHRHRNGAATLFHTNPKLHTLPPTWCWLYDLLYSKNQYKSLVASTEKPNKGTLTSSFLRFPASCTWRNVWRAPQPAQQKRQECVAGKTPFWGQRAVGTCPWTLQMDRLSTQPCNTITPPPFSPKTTWIPLTSYFSVSTQALLQHTWRSRSFDSSHCSTEKYWLSEWTTSFSSALYGFSARINILHLHFPDPDFSL